ncbi:hypothetical protein Bbelb_295920 [Branchiostoma belcheri]|nr:hypothetical protein Bbelb_295920 [Branchiostoma belcheri]
MAFYYGQNSTTTYYSQLRRSSGKYGVVQETAINYGVPNSVAEVRRSSSSTAWLNGIEQSGLRLKYGVVQLKYGVAELRYGGKGGIEQSGLRLKYGVVQLKYGVAELRYGGKGRIGCQKSGITQGTNNITQGKVMVSPSNLCLKNNLPQAHMESPQFPLQDKQRSGISSMVDHPYQRHKIISNIRWENIELANGNLLPATTPSRRLAGQLRPLPGGWHEEPDVRGFRGWGNQYARHPMGQGCSRRNLCA